MATSPSCYSPFFAALSLAGAALLTLSGCYGTTQTNMATHSVSQPSTLRSPMVKAVVGDYASDGYAKRAQGYDWVGVEIRAQGRKQIAITVRSRGDIKKPTCQFKGTATLMGQDDTRGIVFESTVNDSPVSFQFKDKTLTVKSQDRYALNYFCSGGGSIVGDYQKLAGTLTPSE